MLNQINKTKIIKVLKKVMKIIIYHNNNIKVIILINILNS